MHPGRPLQPVRPATSLLLFLLGKGASFLFKPVLFFFILAVRDLQLETFELFVYLLEEVLFEVELFSPGG